MTIFQIGPDLIDDAARLLSGQSFKQHHEFLAPVTRDKAAVSRRRGQPLRDELENAVTDVVAVGVVDLLEMVDVAKGEREWPAGIARLDDSAAKFVLEGATIG